MTSDISTTGVDDADFDTISCTGMSFCSTGASGGSACTWKRKLAAECYEEDSIVKIRVQTNSLPDHCIQTLTRFPSENEIDFEV